MLERNRAASQNVGRPEKGKVERSMTREEFWASPLGIIFIGLIVGVVAVLAIRGVVRLVRSGRDGPKEPPPVRAFPVQNPTPGTRAQDLTFPDDRAGRR